MFDVLPRDGRLLAAAVLALYLAIASAVSVALVWWDKRQASLGRRRIRERTFYIWALLGGFPGGAWSMRRLRHKTVKTSFIWRYTAASALHVIFLLSLGWMALTL